MSQRLRLALSLACALAAACVCALYGSHERRAVEKVREEAFARYGGEVVSLVVCTRTLEAGETVLPTDVREREWLSSLAPEDAILHMDDVVGRELSVPCAGGAPLTELNFRDLAQLADIPSGHVAVSVPITDKLGVPQGVAVGTHVVAYRAAEGEAELIGGNIVVLSSPAVGSSLASRATLTVAVDSGDVPALLAASTSGDLRLVIPADDVRSFAGRRGYDEVAPEEELDAKGVHAGDTSGPGDAGRSEPPRKARDGQVGHVTQDEGEAD